MKTQIVLLLGTFMIMSCASKKYSDNYEPILSFFSSNNENDHLKLDPKKTYILQIEKIENKLVLEIFNGGAGKNHIIDKYSTPYYGEVSFKEIYWEKMYKTYAFDTIDRFWCKEDFPKYNFILKEKKFIVGDKYPDCLIYTPYFMNNEVVQISEPMYYKNKKHVVFYFSKAFAYSGSSVPVVVIMSKLNKKWELSSLIYPQIYP